MELLLEFAAAWVLLYVTGPLMLVLPHELGHGLTALAFGARHAEVSIGAEPRPIRFRIGRLSLRMRLFSRPRHAWFGLAQSDFPNVSRRARLATVAGGPIASLLLVAAYSAAWEATKGSFLGIYLVALTWGAIIQFLSTAIPLRYGRLFGPYDGMTSDGYKIRALLREPREITAEPRQV